MTAKERQRWRDLHARAAAAYREAVASLADHEAATPAGAWRAGDVVAHVEEEHRGDDGSTVTDLGTLQMHTLDLAVHAWDLARSQGQDARLDDDLCLELQAAFAPYVHLMAADGAFAPPVDVPHGASHVQRLVALCGRDPSWSDGPA